MAGIVQSNNFKILSRKIGYSVGLEDTLARARALAIDYTDNRGMTISQWSELVFTKWSLKTNNISDVFASLGLIEQNRNAITPLWGIEVLSILRRMLPHEPEWIAASKYFVCFLIVYFDADVFLNCLASNFEESQMKSSLMGMGKKKFERISKLYSSSQAKAKIYREVKIDSQTSNRGSAGPIEKTSILKAQLNALPTGLRDERFEDFSISEDYLKRKGPPRRAAWARSLKLAEGSSITSTGIELIRGLEAFGFSLGDGIYCGWPISHDLRFLRITPEQLGAPNFVTEDLLRVILKAYLIDQPFSSTNPIPNFSFESFLHHTFELYKASDQIRSSLKVELPIRIASSVLCSVAVAKGVMPPSLTNYLEEEQRRNSRRVDIRTSTYHEGSIVFLQ